MSAADGAPGRWRECGGRSASVDSWPSISWHHPHRKTHVTRRRGPVWASAKPCRRSQFFWPRTLCDMVRPFVAEADVGDFAFATGHVGGIRPFCSATDTRPLLLYQPSVIYRIVHGDGCYGEKGYQK
jgi:hypothetical protein